jgi:hypothetical protein
MRREPSAMREGAVATARRFAARVIDALWPGGPARRRLWGGVVHDSPVCAEDDMFLCAEARSVSPGRVRLVFACKSDAEVTRALPAVFCL